jgi:hypothetical protein
MRILANLTLLAFVGCASPSHPGDPGNVNQGVQVSPGRQFDISPGQEVRVQGSDITIRFSMVSEDSRCAIDVQCVWAGNAVIRLTIAAPGKAASDVALNTTLDPKSAAYDGYTVTLRGLKPQPRSGTPIPSATYVATLEVSR